MKEHAKLQNKIATLMQEREQLKGAPLYSVEAHFQQVEREAKTDTLLQIFYRVIDKLPEDKRNSVHAHLDEILKDTVGPDFYARLKGTIESNHKDYATQEMRDHYIFHKCPGVVVGRNLLGRFVAEASEYVDDKELDTIAEEIETYRSPCTVNLPVEFLRAEVENQKKKNAETITDQDLLKELNDELEIVAQTVITSSEAYSVAHGDSLDKAYSSIINRTSDKISTEMLLEENYKHLQNYFKQRSDGNYSGVRNIKVSYAGDGQMIKNFQEENVKISVSENHKNTLRKVISLMKERGMLAFGGDGSESATKTYGFMQIADAHNKLRKAIKGTDVNAIREAREYYNTACANMREVFKIIEEEINPNSEMLVGNVNSFRVAWIPGEFKNSLFVNAYANSIYNLAMVLQNNDFSLDEFLENPNTAAFKIIEKAASKATPDTRLKEQGFSDAIFDVIKHPLLSSKYPYLAVGRNIEFLTQLSAGSPEYNKNTLGGMLLQSFDGFVLELTRQGELTSVEGYLSQNPESTLANMFLVNEEDRNYNKLRAFEAVTSDGMKKIPPFNTVDYLENHKLDPKIFTERIQATLSDLIKPRGNTSSKDDSLTATELHQIIRAAQLAAYEYLMVNPTPDAGLDKDGLAAYESLKTMIDNPEKAFAHVMSKDLKNEMKTAQPMKKFVANTNASGKKLLETARADARLAETAYNETVENLKKNNASQKDLDMARKQEMDRLKAAYTDGKLPKDYFEQRLQAVEAGEPEKVIPFGADECPSFNEFKKQYANELKAGELSKGDVKFFYNRMVEAAKLEENKFILVSTGLQPKPTLEEDAPEAEAPAAQQETVEAKRESIVVVEAMDGSVRTESVKRLDNEKQLSKQAQTFTQK